MSSNATGDGGGSGGNHNNSGNFLTVPPTPGVVYGPADSGISDNWEMGERHFYQTWYNTKRRCNH